MALIRKIIKTAVVLLEDAIDRFGDTSISEALDGAKQRGAELALENARLEADNGRLTEQLNRLNDQLGGNGPILYSDEIEALEAALPSIEFTLSHRGIHHQEAILNLLQRADHINLTADEMSRYVLDAVNGVSSAKTAVEHERDKSSTIVTEDFWRDD